MRERDKLRSRCWLPGILAILATLLCGALLAGCNDFDGINCSHTWKSFHTETQHRSVCEGCSLATEWEVHAFGAYEPVDAKSHQRACTECGYVEEEAHAFVNGACTRCKYAKEAPANPTEGATQSNPVRPRELPRTPSAIAPYYPPYYPPSSPSQNPPDDPPPHTHSWQTAYSSDGAQHWFACAGCDERRQLEDHEFHWAYEGTKHWQECECGARANEGDHRFGTQWAADGSRHWHACADCGAKADEAEHAYWEGESWERSDAQHWYVCRECGAEVAGTRADHSFGAFWNHDADGHFRSCEDCFLSGAKQPHVYASDQDPDCDECGYVRFEPTKPDVAPSDQ